MAFTEFDRLRAMAIVNIFETGRPFGDYAALAVLNDGAGISYGASQFTHRSGALHEVVARYLAGGGKVGRAIFETRLELLASKDKRAIVKASADTALKNVLKAAGATREMREAQRSVALERYLAPAIRACAGSGFVLPLSLAVIYDSINHGSWAKIRDRIRISAPDVRSVTYEKIWITEYVNERHRWLRSIPRLRSTSYRTSFFLAQIAIGNWQLDLPLNVHGRTLRTTDITRLADGTSFSAAGHLPEIPYPSSTIPTSSDTGGIHASPAETARPPRPTDGVSRYRETLMDALVRYDGVEAVLQSLVRRADSAKSLWTTVAGTAWQALWAVVAFVIGLPREVWLVTAILAGILASIYLYRQFVLGRIREIHGLAHLAPPAERHGNSANEL